MDLTHDKKTQDLTAVFDRYDQNHELPMREYAILLSVFTLSFAGAYTLSSKKRRTVERIEGRDVILLGVAAHKLSRAITKEKITGVLRAPFTERGESKGLAEVTDHSRGQGMRRAIGDLITCPFCLGMWISTFLGYGLLWAPRFTRFVSTILAVDTISDGLQIAYAKMKRLV